MICDLHIPSLFGLMSIISWLVLCKVVAVLCNIGDELGYGIICYYLGFGLADGTLGNKRLAKQGGMIATFPVYLDRFCIVVFSFCYFSFQTSF